MSYFFGGYTLYVGRDTTPKKKDIKGPGRAAGKLVSIFLLIHKRVWGSGFRVEDLVCALPPLSNSWIIRKMWVYIALN